MRLKHLPSHAARWIKHGPLAPLALKARSAYLAVIKRRLEAASNPGARLSRLAGSPLLPLRAADQVMLMLLGERDPLFLRLLDHSADVAPATLRVLLRIYGADYRGQPLGADEIKSGLATLKAAHWRPTRSNVLYFMLGAIKNGDLDLVRAVLDAFPGFPLGTLPAAYKTGVLRLAAQQGEGVYARWRETAAPSPLEEVQIQDIDARAGFAVPVPHAAMGQALRAVVPAPMQAELDTRILPFFTEQADRMRWMDCRNDPAQRAAFIDDIAGHLRAGTPYSLIRLGDGESYAWQDRVSAEHAARREQVWWGAPLDAARRAQIGTDMLAAIASANRLGIPSLFRFTRDTHPELGSYTRHVSILGLIHVLDGLRTLPPAPRLYTEERIHQLCFDMPTVARLSADARKLVIVSSLTADTIRTQLRDRIGRAPLEVIEVPTHTKTRGNAMFVQAEQTLPFVYREIDAQIAQVTEPGTLVLVASGSIGKIFCATAQRAGGVALDVGAMIDYWVGLKTRSIADMS